MSTSVTLLADPAFEAALDDNPDDWGLRQIYADWLEERGEVDLATFLRLMATARKRPEYRPVSFHDTPWGWHDGFFDKEEWCRSTLVNLIPHLPRDDEVGQAAFRVAEGLHSGNRSSFHLTRRSAELALYHAWLAAGKPNTL